MRYFGFGEEFIKMLFLLFSKLEMCTTNNGFYSQMFFKTRGVNQGCPASPQVFCYCSEIMSHLIYQNSAIKGVTIGNLEKILSQFADDTSAYLKYSRLCIESFIDTLVCVEKLMGLKVSYEKTTVYRIGSLANSDALIYTQRQLKWLNKAIETLGVCIKCDGEMDPGNYTEIRGKVGKVCSNWINRNASLHGKIMIINTLMFSLFTYKLTAMLTMSSKQILEIEKIAP